MVYFIRRLTDIRFFQIFPSWRKSKYISAMNSSPSSECFSSLHNYEEAVTALNSLQSNAAVLEKARAQKDRWAQLNIPQTQKFLHRVGISLEDIDRKLKIVHVSGTKGKGSTCAFCESILRHHGLKTGFYSSPHLIEVRERLQINGKPLSKNLFAKYFWQIYSVLSEQKEREDDMPAYFKFLTVMAIYVFIKEQVDVAIMEVGIGGLYDCTNVIRKPSVVGITTLDLDHVSILGDTIEKIAVHKAGIMKPGIPAFTVPDQPGESLKVLADRALEIQCPLYTVPPLESYQWGQFQITLGLSGDVQLKNASLALQLSNAILEFDKRPYWSKPITSDPLIAEPFKLSSAHAMGLAFTNWPGRSQIIRDDSITFFIDGAHTPESIVACVQWFQSKSSGSVRGLIFNTTGDRNTERLLAPLHSCSFALVVFSPNIFSSVASTPKDLQNFMVTREQQVARSRINKENWITHVNPANGQNHMVLSVENINEALDEVRKFGARNSCQMDVLVTGSLHLVGGVLSLLDPDLYSEKDADRKCPKCHVN